jgi:hypothetical protein
MKFPRRQFLHLAAGAATLPAFSRVARAQAYPARPITMVVPYAAGGPLDAIARVMARADAHIARPVRRSRKRDRCRRHDWCRPRGPRAARWLHGQHRQLGFAFGAGRDLPVTVRPPE